MRMKETAFSAQHHMPAFTCIFTGTKLKVVQYFYATRQEKVFCTAFQGIWMQRDFSSGRLSGHVRPGEIPLRCSAVQCALRSKIPQGTCYFMTQRCCRFYNQDT